MHKPCNPVTARLYASGGAVRPKYELFKGVELWVRGGGNAVIAGFHFVSKENFLNLFSSFLSLSRI